MGDKIVGGEGVRSAQFGGHTILSATGKRAKFRGAWWCSRVGDNELRVALGYLNGIEPYIGRRRMSGIDDAGVADPEGSPLLKLKSDLFDKTGRSRICVRVKVDGEGKMKPGKDLTPDDLCIVQHPTAVSSDELVGLFAVAIFRKTADTASGESFGDLRQIAYFDQKHATRKPEKGRRQHFFSPAS
jgi:hypothetical protein